MNCKKNVKNQILIEIFEFLHYNTYTMRNANYTVINAFVVILIVCSLIFSSVVFLIGNKVDFDFSSLVQSDSIVADFFASSSVSDKILKDKLPVKAENASHSSASDKQTDKEVNFINNVHLYDFEIRENNKDVKNFQIIHYINFLSGPEEYPLKIPFNCFIVFIMILYGLIFRCLARSIPLASFFVKKRLMFLHRPFLFWMQL